MRAARAGRDDERDLGDAERLGQLRVRSDVDGGETNRPLELVGQPRQRVVDLDRRRRLRRPEADQHDDRQRALDDVCPQRLLVDDVDDELAGPVRPDEAPPAHRRLVLRSLGRGRWVRREDRSTAPGARTAGRHAAIL